MSFTLVSKLDFGETWKEMKEVISQYAQELLPQLGDLLIYEISHALATPGHTTDKKKLYALDRFLQENDDLRNGPDIQELVHASKQGSELCAFQSKLTQTVDNFPLFVYAYINTF